MTWAVCKSSNGRRGDRDDQSRKSSGGRSSRPRSKIRRRSKSKSAGREENYQLMDDGNSASQKSKGSGSGRSKNRSNIERGKRLKTTIY